MLEIPDNFVQLIMTSPPYPKGMRSYEQECSVHADQYVSWITPMLEATKRVLHPEGSCVIVIMDKIIDGVLHPYIDELKLKARQVGLFFTGNYNQASLKDLF